MIVFENNNRKNTKLRHCQIVLSAVMTPVGQTLSVYTNNNARLLESAPEHQTVGECVRDKLQGNKVTDYRTSIHNL